MDDELAGIAERIERTQWAAIVCDAGWRLRWVSPELKRLLLEEDEQRLGYGKHLLAAYVGEAWQKRTGGSGGVRQLEDLPLILGSSDLDSLAGELGVERSVLEEAAGREVPDVWSGTISYLSPHGLPPATIAYVSFRLRTGDGTVLGTAIVFGSAIRGSVLDLVARGDDRMLERMAGLLEPRREPAAILFADLQGSSQLSRRLASGAFFRLIRAFTTRVDEVVIRHLGLVGKHAGDGVTAFLPAADHGGASAAARATITAAREIQEATRAAVEELAADGLPLEPDDAVLNVGIHFAPGLYLGQLVTGGRLEVTALGDQVNECARVQQSARDGAVLATKALVEQLEPDDAEALGIAVEQLGFKRLADWPGAPEKAARDAGDLSVVAL